jgi:hypothetical protein
MSNYTKSQAIKEMRAKAKILGMTFKTSSITLNDVNLYKLTNRKTGKTLIDNYMFWTAYADLSSGFWDTIKL